MNDTGPSPSPLRSFSWARVLRWTVPLLVALAVLSWLAKTRLAIPTGPVSPLDGDDTTLAGGYTDANGDLLADLPADRSQWLDPEVLVFSGPVSLTPEKELAAWVPFVGHLQAVTGKQVDHRPLTSVPEQLEALREGRVHVTAVNTGTVPAAVNRAGFIPAYCPATEGGASAYEVLLLTPAGSALRSPADLRGTTLALTAATSFAGYQAPLVLLREEFGLVPGRDYEFLLTGSHGASIRGVARGTYPAAFVASDAFDLLRAHGEVRDADVQIVHRSTTRQLVGAYGYVYNLDPDLAGRIRHSFETFSLKGNSVGEHYRGTGWVRFAPIDYARDWEYVRQVNRDLRKLGLNRGKGAE